MMETKRVHTDFIVLKSILLVIILSSVFTSTEARLSPEFSYSQKKVAHQQQIAMDNIGMPHISGDEFEEAIERSNYASTKVKRQQQQQQQQQQSEEKPATQTASPPLSTVPTTLPPPSTITTTTEDIEAENTTLTPTSSEPSSISTSSTAATTPSTIATTEVTTTTSTEEPQYLPAAVDKGYFCLCDIQVQICDMECCCDLDCTKEQIELFKGCSNDSRIYDPNSRRNKEYSCVKQYVMFQENSALSTDRSDKNLFCVIKENVKQAREFTRADMEKISRKISHGKLNTRPKYTWDNLYGQPTKTRIDRNQPYKYASPIWSVRANTENGDSQEVMFRLPAPFLTEICTILEPVKYLHSFESHCIRPMHNVIAQCETLKELNANHFIKDQMIIVNPTKSENWTDSGVEKIVPVKVCYNTISDCKSISLDYESSDSTGNEEEFPVPTLEGGVLNALYIASGKCTNVLSQLNLTIIHEGIEGITRVLATALLVDLPADKNEIEQEFRVEFVWNNERKGVDGTVNDTGATSMEELLNQMKLPRSGNPGYMVGKPLILGRKVISETPKNDTEGKPKFFMHVQPDESKWLRIQGAGDCPLTQKEIKEDSRHPILFGYDHVSMCRLALEHFQTCEDLQTHISSVIFGYTRELNPKEFTSSAFYVAAYGSPDAFPADWVQLKFVDTNSLTQGLFPLPSTFGSNTVSRGCGSIVTSLHITVSYAYVGPVDAPQAKVTGVFYEAEQPVSIPDSTEETRIKDIAVSTTVSFLDVTGKATTRVATFPVVSVQLPSDFFYPFSSSKPGPSSVGTINIGNYYFILVLSLQSLFIIL